jgi:hypothetical protein
MGEVKGESHVVATYREIAAHFGLRGADQGRTKAKRAGWSAEPRNHPADPVRVRVPRAAWEGASSSRAPLRPARGGFRSSLSGGRSEGPPLNEEMGELWQGETPRSCARDPSSHQADRGLSRDVARATNAGRGTGGRGPEGADTAARSGGGRGGGGGGAAARGGAAAGRTRGLDRRWPSDTAEPMS